MCPLTLVPDKYILRTLSAEQNADLMRKLTAVQAVITAGRGDKVAIAHRMASAYQVSVQAIHRWAGAYRAHGAAGLIDHRRTPKCADTALPTVTAQWFKDLIIRSQRNNSIREARRQALDQWRLWKRTGDPKYAVPGYITPPADCGKGHPHGWSYKTFCRCAPTKYQSTLSRQGRIASDRMLPSILGTRVGTRYLEVIYFDDQKYDHHITAAGFTRPMVPMGFNALDKLTAYAFQPHIRLRWFDEVAEKHRSLTMREFMWYVIHILTTVGYRTDEVGTTLVKEHGTANTWSNKTLRTPLGFNSFEDAVTSLLDGHVRLDDSGLYNKAIWKELIHGPQSSGNPRFKAPIESFFNVVRSYHLALPGQTGRNRDEAPEENYGLLAYETKLAEKAAELPEALRQAIRGELFTASEFAWFSHLAYTALNERTDHRIQGWEDCGFVVPAWRWAEDPPDLWRSRQELASLPQHLIEHANHQARLDPSLRKPVRMSPADAMQSVCHDPDVRKLSREDAVLLLPLEWATPITITKNHEIQISDSMLSTEPIIFFSELTNPQGRTEYLHPGDQVLAHVNPFDLDSLLILNQAGAFIGTVTRNHRNGRDKDMLEQMFRERARLAGNIGSRTRHAMSPIANQRQIDKANNDDLIRKHRLATEGKPATEAEQRTAAGQQAHRTAAANRLQTHGTAQDWDAPAEAVTTPTSAWDNLPDDDDLPSRL
ncbi:MAG: hypothetical protein ACNA8L_10425 [Luteolibacter sp.]